MVHRYFSRYRSGGEYVQAACTPSPPVPSRHHNRAPATAVDSELSERLPSVIDPEAGLAKLAAGIHPPLPCFHGSRLLRHDVTRGYVRQQSVSVQP